MQIINKITKYNYIQNLYNKNYQYLNDKNFWDEALKILNIKYHVNNI